MFMKPSRLLNLELRTSLKVVFKVYFWQNSIAQPHFRRQLKLETMSKEGPSVCHAPVSLSSGGQWTPVALHSKTVTSYKSLF